MSQRSYDVIVVGAGVFGLWTAYHLRRAGKCILLIDAFGAGHEHSTSGDESRVMRMGYGADDLYTRAALRSLQLWGGVFASLRNFAQPNRSCMKFAQIGS